MGKLDVGDLIDMFDDNTEQRVQAEIKVGTLRKIIMDLKDYVVSNKINIKASKDKVQRLFEDCQEKANKIHHLEKQYRELKGKKIEVEKRLSWLALKDWKLSGQDNASILSYEELFEIKSKMVSTHS